MTTLKLDRRNGLDNYFLTYAGQEVSQFNRVEHPDEVTELLLVELANPVEVTFDFDNRRVGGNGVFAELTEKQTSDIQWQIDRIDRGHRH
ncbi:MAG: hypothetical protein ACR2PG_20330, partial [Hyphomicrobiaceae bacterium]